MRVLYMAGPGDVLNTYRCWQAGADDPSQVAMTYSGQFFDVCDELPIESSVIAYHVRADELKADRIRIEHRPQRFVQRRGLLYHVGQYWFNLTIVWTAISERCRLILPMTGTHLTPYWIARLFGIAVVPIGQCTLWPKHVRPKRFRRWVHWCDRWFYRGGCNSILCISNEIADQIDELTGGVHAKIEQFLPSYRRAVFDTAESQSATRRPFRVLFAGRIEKNKGVFDLIDVARRLADLQRDDIEFDLAGDGAALDAVVEAIDRDDLRAMVKVHGKCDRSQMRNLLAGSHAVIVPTRTDFIEGFNKVVAESVLAKRPFITSSVCPALEYVRDAGIEVPPDDVAAYADAILRLADDPELYAAKSRACESVREQFFDENRSWATALRRTLIRVLDLKVPEDELVLIGSPRCARLANAPAEMPSLPASNLEAQDA